MNKAQIIKRIKTILGDYGCFSIGELEIEPKGIAVGTLGKFIGLAEYFTEDYTEIKVYEPTSFSSDEVDSYELKYDDIDKVILIDILSVCEQYEAEQIRTKKRILN